MLKVNLELYEIENISNPLFAAKNAAIEYIYKEADGLYKRGGKEWRELVYANIAKMGQFMAEILVAEMEMNVDGDMEEEGLDMEDEQI